MYFIIKNAVYSHGVMWLGESLDLAKKEADRLASASFEDGYHDYEVFEFRQPTQADRDWQDSCEFIYKGEKL